MQCTAKKADGTLCKKQAQKDFLTCMTASHRAQEPGTGNIPTTKTTASTPAPTGEVRRYGSMSKNNGFVVQGKLTDANGNITQPSIRADFVNGEYTTSNPIIIAALDAHIEKNPNSRWLHHA